MPMKHGSRSFLSPWDKVTVGWHLDFSLIHPGQRNHKNCSMNNCVFKKLSSVQFSRSVVSDSCDPMNCGTPSLPVHHQLAEFTQILVCWVGDAIQLSHPLSSPSPPALSLSQHQGLFKWVNSLHKVAKVLEFQLQHQSFQWTPRISPLGWTGWISLQSKGLSRVFSNNTV